MTRQERLINWVALQHEGQLIKNSNEPYLNHLVAVAGLAEPCVTLGYETGLCHDLLEDTAVTQDDLSVVLSGFGYNDTEARLITSRVMQLTDIYTKTAYPLLSKKARKAREARRLLTISPEAQTVKYADLIYNIAWVLKYDREHAEKYLLKKQELLVRLTLGDQHLWRQALAMIRQELLNFAEATKR